MAAGELKLILIMPYLTRKLVTMSIEYGAPTTEVVGASLIARDGTEVDVIFDAATKAAPQSTGEILLTAVSTLTKLGLEAGSFETILATITQEKEPWHEPVEAVEVAEPATDPVTEVDAVKN